MKRSLAVASALALATTGIAAQSGTAATSYRACVKKSTGEMRMMTKGMTKCKKGWKKLTWSKAGPTGNSGAPGAQGTAGSASYLGVVVDGAGAVVGKAMSGIAIAPSVLVMQVLIDGGSYAYLANGQLLPLGSPIYLDATCAEAPFLPADDLQDVAVWGSSSLIRITYRSTVPVLGPARAFKLAGTTGSIIAAPTYSFSSAGACELNDPMYSGYRIDLTEVTAPQDRPGPLRLF